MYLFLFVYFVVFFFFEPVTPHTYVEFARTSLPPRPFPVSSPLRSQFYSLIRTVAFLSSIHHLHTVAHIYTRMYTWRRYSFFFLSFFINPIFKKVTSRPPRVLFFHPFFFHLACIFFTPSAMAFTETQSVLLNAAVLLYR